MNEIFVLFSKSIDQILKDYKKIKKIVFILVFFDIFDYLTQTIFLPKIGSDILASCYSMFSFLFSLYLGLFLLIQLNEIALNKQIKIKAGLYLKYLWANVIIVAGSLTALLTLFLIWLLLNASKNFDSAYQSLTAIQVVLAVIVFTFFTLVWLLFNIFTSAAVINEKLSAKHCVSKSFNLVKVNFKTVLFFGLFTFLITTPAWLDLLWVLYKVFIIKEYVRDYFGVWSLFVTFYSLFIGLLISLTTLNLYKKLSSTKLQTSANESPHLR